MKKTIPKIIALILILLVLAILSKTTHGLVVDPMVPLVNTQRLLHRVKPLKENILLNKSAKNKACDIFEKGYWSHYSPNGKTPWDFMSESGYKHIQAGENLARNFDSDDEAMNAFMRSEGHRRNILRVEYTEIGIGRCGNITVQHFGTPYVGNK